MRKEYAKPVLNVVELVSKDNFADSDMIDVTTYYLNSIYSDEVYTISSVQELALMESSAGTVL